MKEIIAIVLFISQFGYIYCEFVTDFQAAINSCCEEVYKNDEANNKKCVETIQEGFKGGPVEETYNKASKNKPNGVTTDGTVTFLSSHFLLLCKYEAGIAKRNSDVITAEVFGFIMASGFNLLNEEGYERFSDYIITEGKKGQDKLTEIINNKVPYFQYLFICSSDAYYRFNEFGSDLFSDSFKEFIKNYYYCFVSETKKKPDLALCTTYKIINMYKTIKTDSSNFNNFITPEIKKC